MKLLTIQKKIYRIANLLDKIYFVELQKDMKRGKLLAFVENKFEVLCFEDIWLIRPLGEFIFLQNEQGGEIFIFSPCRYEGQAKSASYPVVVGMFLSAFSA